VAAEHDVAGWAGNREDGTVEVVLEGDAGAVDAVIAFCRSGPARAAVSEVEVIEEEPEGLSGFSIS
jgi:acylphosphatase